MPVPDPFIPPPYTWTPVPGTDNVEIYHIVRKPSVLCSNTYIIKAPELFIVIDPGTDPEQIEHGRQVVLEKRQGKAIPVFLFLTHCHIDHFLAVNLLMDQTFNGQFICHPLAADAIETKDENLTLANMNGSVLPICKVRDCFFHDKDHPIPAEESPLTVESGIVELDDGQVIPCNIVPLGGNDRIEIFQTPGHSPDSITYVVGRFMYTGDLHVATTPGIAGKNGWDNMALVSSIRAMIDVGRKREIAHILPGHGKVIDFEKATNIFLKEADEALHLTSLALFDRERSLYLSEYAIVLLEETSSIFSIIAARLLKVSYYLDMLGEHDRAQSIPRIIDTDMLDRTVDEFHTYIRELKGARGAPVISKAVQFSRKVNRIFEPEKISHLFDPCFLRRIKSLLADFVNVVYGIRFRDQETTFGLNTAVQEALASLKKDPAESERIFETLDDDREFIDELTRRIAYTPLFSGTRFTFSRSEEELDVTADRLMFQDMLNALLEQLAIADIDHISLETGRGETGAAALSVTCGGNAKPFALRESKVLYLKHSMKIAGGEFEKIIDRERELYRFIFS